MHLHAWFARLFARRDQWSSRQSRSLSRRAFADCAAECLEVRELLSNVALTIQSGVISLTGDSGNHTVDASVVAGKLHLVGSAGTTFTFNGATTSIVDVKVGLIGPINSIHITMLNGDDTVNFNALNLGTVSKNFVVDMGGGTNSFNLTHATVGGILAVHGSTGANTVLLSNDTLQAAAIHTGAGNDVVTLTAVNFSGKTSYFPADPTDLSQDSWIPGSSLLIDTGAGTDTVTLTSVVGASSLAGDQWTIVGSGNATVTLTTDTNHGSLFVQRLASAAAAGTETVDINGCTFDKTAAVRLAAGLSHITVEGSTFNAAALLSTGLGNASTISVDSSIFAASAAFSLLGTGATLNLETRGLGGPGLVFHGSVLVSQGPSGIVNFANNGGGNTLVFDGVVHVAGSFPATTLTIADAHVTIPVGKLTLSGTTRVDI